MNFYERHSKVLLPVLAVLSFLFLLFFYLTPVTTNDFWIQLKVGQLIKQNLEIPKTILFTFTHLQGEPFVAHEWLPSLIFSLFYDAFGYNFMIVLKFLLYSTSFLLAFNLARMITGNLLYALFISLVALFTLNYRSFLRPEAFSYILFLSQITLLFLFQKKGGLKYLAWYLLLNVIWVNSHGSFLVSLGFPFLFASCRMLDVLVANHFRGKKAPLFTHKEKQLFALGGLSILTSLINPLGIKLLIHSYELSQDKLLRNTIFEWRPMLSASVMKSTIFKVFLIFMSILSLIMAFRFRHLSAFSWTLLVLFTYLAFGAQRHMAFLAIASVWPLAEMLKDIPRKSSFSTVTALALVFILPLLCLRSWYKGNTVRVRPGFYHSARMSEGSLDFIRKKGLKGNTLNTYTLGGQLIFNFYPKLHVGIDSRVDAYGVDYARRYRQMIYGKYSQLKKFLDTYDVQNIIVNGSAFNRMKKTGSYKNLKEEGWKLAYKSRKVVIIEKKKQL